MDAGDGLLGILGIHFEFGLAVLFGDGEDAQRLDRFERVGGLGVEHANANVQVVTAIEKDENHEETDEDSFRENGCGSQD